MIAARMLKELGVVIEHLKNSFLAEAEATYFSPSAISGAHNIKQPVPRLLGKNDAQQSSNA